MVNFQTRVVIYLAGGGGIREGGQGATLVKSVSAQR